VLADTLPPSVQDAGDGIGTMTDRICRAVRAGVVMIDTNDGSSLDRDLARRHRKILSAAGLSATAPGVRYVLLDVDYGRWAPMLAPIVEAIRAGQVGVVALSPSSPSMPKWIFNDVLDALAAVDGFVLSDGAYLTPNVYYSLFRKLLPDFTEFLAQQRQAFRELRRRRRVTGV
jgi:hypothetical protein